jgi:hypothetical protein
MQGETERQKAEWWTWCTACAEGYVTAPREELCQSCGEFFEMLVPTRDAEEGLNGAVLWVCAECKAEDRPLRKVGAQRDGGETEQRQVP